jgi:hypothetical protein
MFLELNDNFLVLLEGSLIPLEDSSSLMLASFAPVFPELLLKLLNATGALPVTLPTTKIKLY